MSHAPARHFTRRLGFRLAGILLGLAAGCLLLELAIRLFESGSLPPRRRQLLCGDCRPPRDLHCYSSNPHGEFVPVPDCQRGSWRLIDFSKHQYPLTDLSLTPWSVEYRRTSLGLREPELSPTDETDRLRVLVLGDSFVFGEGVPVERSFCRWAEEFCPVASQWINAGRSGADTRDELHLARQLEPLLRPDRLLVVWTPNDVPIPESMVRQENAIFDLINLRRELLEHPTGALRWLSAARLGRWLLSDLILRRVQGDTIAWYQAIHDPARNPQGLAQWAADLRGLRDLAPGRMVLVLYPLLVQLESEYPLAAAHREVARLARAEGIAVCDLAPALSGQQTELLWVHPVDHHPNGEAHRLAAAALVAWLEANQPTFLAGGGSQSPADR